MAYATSQPVYSRRPAAAITHSPVDSGRLLLRLLVGVLLLAHGIAKVKSGPAPIIEVVTQAGWPAVIAYGVYLGEVLAPLLLIAGVWTRPAAIVIALNMVAAIALAHADEVFTMNEQGGYALELQAFYLFGALAIALLGAGRYSLGGATARWN